MTRKRLILLLAGGIPVACGTGDNTQPDASSMDVTSPDVADEPDVYEAAVDVAIDVPPERAIWVATASTLFKFDPTTRVMKRVANFDCNGELMVDLAMDVNEQLYGITTQSVVQINKYTAECFPIARGALDLPYATSFIPAVALEAGTEGWFGYKYSSYSRIDRDAGALTYVGDLGPMAGNFQASGDLVTIPGKGTYMTAFNLDPMTGDLIVEVDPNTGATTSIDTATGVSSLVGLAQWAGYLYLFSEKGVVYRGQVTDAGINIQTLGVTFDYGDASTTDAGADADAAIEASGPISWRGAAVTTRAPGM